MFHGKLLDGKIIGARNCPKYVFYTLSFIMCENSCGTFIFEAFSPHTQCNVSTLSSIIVGFFIRPFYKMMLGKQISLKDMESVVRPHSHTFIRYFIFNVLLVRSRQVCI